MRILSVGEILWDVFPGKELLGGAPLNFAANAARLGNSAALLTAIGEDARGQAAKREAASLGILMDFFQTVSSVATGTATVSTTAQGEPHFTIARPAAFDCIDLSDALLEKIHLFDPDWLYFGTLAQTSPHTEEMTARIRRELPHIRCLYDMNLRPDNWNLLLVERLCSAADLLKLNDFEARTLGSLTGMAGDSFSFESFCQQWSARFAIETICITLGPEGCAVYDQGRFFTVAGYPAKVADTVGAGDAFSAAFLHGYQQRWPLEDTARFANALGSIVASRAGATPPWSLEECFALASLPMPAGRKPSSTV